jgi:hypothetical protein
MTVTPAAARPRPDESAATLGRAGTVAIVTLAALRLLEAVLWTAAALGTSALPTTGGIAAATELEVGTLALLAVAAIDVFCGIGLLLSWRWGWVLTMLVTGIGLISEILAYLAGDPGYLRLAILVASAFFLNQRPVRVRFGIPAR